MACTARFTPKSTNHKKTPNKATVISTTQVVDTTSSRVGQVTCFSSTRVSWRNSFASVSELEIFSPMPAAAPVMAFPSPFFTFTACVAIFPSIYFLRKRRCRSLLLRPVSSGTLNSGRGGGIRTPIPGFGDRSPDRWTTPLNSIPVCPENPPKQKLFHFLVRRLFAARVAELLRFQTLAVLLLVFCRGVVAVLAFPALQCNGFAHVSSSLLSTRRLHLIAQVQQPAHYRLGKRPYLRFFPALILFVIAAPSAGPASKPLFGIVERFLDFDPPYQITLGVRTQFFRARDRKPEKAMSLPNLQAFPVQPLRHGLYFQSPHLAPALQLPPERLQIVPH